MKQHSSTLNSDQKQLKSYWWYLQLLLLFDPLLLGVGDEREEWTRLVLFVLEVLGCRFLTGWTLAWHQSVHG